MSEWWNGFVCGFAVWPCLSMVLAAAIIIHDKISFRYFVKRVEELDD